jgi:sulfur relay (sulfurtransferase) DsrC/TusE family protein
LVELNLTIKALLQLLKPALSLAGVYPAPRDRLPNDLGEGVSKLIAPSRKLVGIGVDVPDVSAPSFFTSAPTPASLKRRAASSTRFRSVEANWSLIAFSRRYTSYFTAAPPTDMVKSAATRPQSLARQYISLRTKSTMLHSSFLETPTSSAKLSMLFFAFFLRPSA